MYRNIDDLMESVKYEVEESDEHIEDIIHRVVDTEVSNNTWYLNCQVIEVDYDSDIITAINNYNREYGDIDLTERISAYAQLAFPYIIASVRKLWEEHVEELNDN